MAPRLRVELNPARIEMEPGAATIEAVVTLENLSDLVEQYTIDIVGIDAEWYSAPVNAIGLFPHDRDQVKVSFHPPKKQGVRAGTYHFKVRARSRAGGAEETADGVLEVLGTANFRLELSPRRGRGRGSVQYKLAIANSGTADARIALEGKDPEELTQFQLPADPVLVPAGSRVEVPMHVTPKKRPLLGEERTYSFVVIGKPAGSPGEPQNAQGALVYVPFRKNLGCLPKVLLAIVGIILILTLGSLLFSFGLSRFLPREALLIRGSICPFARYVPFLFGGLCGGGSARPTVRGQGTAASPSDAPQCVFEEGFRQFAEAEKRLIGDCTNNVDYDIYGNGIQYTKNGMLFWNKASNTIYFVSGPTVFVRTGERTRILDGPRPQTLPEHP